MRGEFVIILSSGLAVTLSIPQDGLIFEKATTIYPLDLLVHAQSHGWSVRPRMPEDPYFLPPIPAGFLLAGGIAIPENKWRSNASASQEVYLETYLISKGYDIIDITALIHDPVADTWVFSKIVDRGQDWVSVALDSAIACVLVLDVDAYFLPVRLGSAIHEVTDRCFARIH